MFAREGIFSGSCGTSLVPRCYPLRRKRFGEFLGCAVNSEEANATPCKLATDCHVVMATLHDCVCDTCIHSHTFTTT